MMKKIIFGLEFIIIAAALIYVSRHLKPQLIFPASGLVVHDLDFHFQVEDADKILISSSQDFAYPVTLRKNEQVNLNPGTYYWKAVSFFGESETRNFTITENLVLKINDRSGVSSGDFPFFHNVVLGLIGGGL